MRSELKIFQWQNMKICVGGENYVTLRSQDDSLQCLQLSWVENFN